MYVTLKNGTKLLMPTDEEDAAITSAAMSDPDAIPLTDEEWEAVQPFVQVGGVPINAQAVRARTGLSQREFADMLRVSVKTLQHWEQRRRTPSGPAAALLTLAAKAPKVVMETLRA